MNKKRLGWLDYQKGVAIFLVVLGHVYQTCLLDTGAIFAFIYTFHMPFFFMLSGILAWKETKRKFMVVLRRKAESLLVPFITCGLVFSFCYGKVYNFIYSEFHAGYWFLLSLFSCWLIFLLLIKMLSRIPDFKGKFVLEIMVLILPFFLGRWILSYINSEVVCWLSLSFTFSFYRFFLLGYFGGRLINKIQILGKTKLKLELLSILFVMFVFLTVCTFNKCYFIDYLTYTGLQILLCIGFFGTILLYKKFTFDKENTFIQCLGKNSLTIYCFHYFVFKQINLSMLNGYSEGIKFIVAVISSMFVIALVLVFARPLKSKYLSYIFLGKK